MLKFLFELRKSKKLRYNYNGPKNLDKAVSDFIKGVNSIDIECEYYSLLTNSICTNATEIVKYFADKFDIKSINKNGVNSLHLAAICNNVEIGKCLLEKIDVNTTDNQKHTPLMYAISNHSNEFINFLLQNHSVDINCQDIFHFFN